MLAARIGLGEITSLIRGIRLVGDAGRHLPFSMFTRFSALFCLTMVAPLAFADTVNMVPGPEPLSVTVSGAQDGVRLRATTLTVVPPEYRDKMLTAPAPANHAPYMDNWLPWPGANPKRKRPGAVNLGPRTDDDGVLILGQPFRQYPVEHITVSSADGRERFVAGQDYRVQPDYGQIVNLNSRLGKPLEAKVKVSYREVQQRLDLVQADRSGRLSIKTGKSAIVCPMLPEPDAGHMAVAGIYVAPWLTEASPLAPYLMNPIQPTPPVAPVNPQAVAKTRAKLEQGKPVAIAYMGDSLTLGAEAGKWWQDNTQHWRGRFQNTLRERYPDATISEIAAWQGGKGTEFGLQVLESAVLPEKPDLLIIMMGVNDADGPVGGEPKVAPEDFSKNMARIIEAAKEAGIEVILMTSMQPHPGKANGHAKRWETFVEVQRNLAAKHRVGLADTYQEWMNLESLGMPPYVQLHNLNNHPGSFGHGVLASVPLRFFPGK